MKSPAVCLLFTILLMPSMALALPAEEQGDAGYEPTAENIAAREWFRQAKFGLFIHWGIYSVLGRGEWVMHNENIPIAEYEKLAGRFNPDKFNPDQWCRLAADAGMRYITITSKHHDGFAMYGSRASGYNVVDKTPFSRDVLNELAEACRRHGLKLFFYHSQLDWHHPDYFPRGSSYAHGRPESGDWQAYLDYMDAELEELLTGYGPIGGIWFDGMWEKPDADWRLGRTYRLIHRLQPSALVGSNHHARPYPGEDYQMFEKGLPGKDPFNKGSGISNLPLETCETINDSWGYNSTDRRYKSVRELVQYLVRAAGNDANFLLNVGPKPDGTIQAEFQQRLAGIGEWLRKNGDTIYGSRGGPFPPQSWGVTTQKAGRVFLHVLEQDRVVALPDIGRKVAAAKLMDGSAIEFGATGLSTLLKIPESGADPYDTIIELTLQ